MQNVAASETVLFDSAVLEPSAFAPAVLEPSAFAPAVLEPSAFAPAVLEPSAFAPAVFEPVVFQSNPAPALLALKPLTSAPGKTLLRTLLLKWDMIAVVALMLACTIYGVYAVCFLTGF